MYRHILKKLFIYPVVNKYYVRAFTIVETVVSMVITAIILCIVFVIFSITSQRLQDFKKQNESIADINRLTYSINKGIFESEDMQLINNEIHFKSYDASNTTYKLTNNYLTKQTDEFIDTFHLKINKMIIDTLASNSNKENYQRLKCILKINDQNIDLNFYKKIYANKILIPLSTK